MSPDSSPCTDPRCPHGHTTSPTAHSAAATSCLTGSTPQRCIWYTVAHLAIPLTSPQPILPLSQPAALASPDVSCPYDT